MARRIFNRPNLRSTVQQFDATRADMLVGVHVQVLADGAAPAGGQVETDPEASLIVSYESTTAPTFTGLDLTDEAVPAIERTFSRPAGATQQVTVQLAQPIEGNTAYTLDAAGSAITLMPVFEEQGAPATGWVVKNAIGTVTAVP